MLVAWPLLEAPSADRRPPPPPEPLPVTIGTPAPQGLLTSTSSFVVGRAADFALAAGRAVAHQDGVHSFRIRPAGRRCRRIRWSIVLARQLCPATWVSLSGGCGSRSGGGGTEGAHRIHPTVPLQQCGPRLQGINPLVFPLVFGQPVAQDSVEGRHMSEGRGGKARRRCEVEAPALLSSTLRPPPPARSRCHLAPTLAPAVCSRHHLCLLGPIRAPLQVQRRRSRRFTTAAVAVCEACSRVGRDRPSAAHRHAGLPLALSDMVLGRTSAGGSPGRPV